MANDQEIAFSVSQGGVALELTFDNWRDFTKTMRTMGPLWQSASSFELLCNKVAEATKEK